MEPEPGEGAEARTEDELEEELGQYYEAIAGQGLAKGKSPTFMELPVELMKKVIHNHSPEQIPEAVKKMGKTHVSTQIAFAFLTSIEAEHLKSLVRQDVWLAQLSGKKRPMAVADLQIINEVESFSTSQISKGRDGNERRISVSQLIGTFRQALEQNKKEYGKLDPRRYV